MIKMNITKAYNQLTTTGKEIVRDKVQNGTGWSRANFYLKVNAPETMNENEKGIFLLFLKKELKQQIALSTDALNQLENENKFKREKK